MDRNRILNDEIKLLRFLSIAHYLIIIVSLYLYYIGLKEFYYSSKIYYGIMNYSIIFKIIYIIIPSSLLLLAFPSLKQNIKYYKILKFLTFSFLIISFIIGILINISVWKTSTEAETFISNCPYHFSQSLLTNIIDKENNEKDKYSKICKIRICTFYSEDDINNLPYNYFCNYNSLNDFKKKNDGTIYKRINSEGKEISSKDYIQCSKIKNITFSDENIKKFLNLCDNNIYYKCQLFEKLKEKDINSVNNKEICPGKNYEKVAYLLSVSYTLIDIICFTFLFLIEFLILLNLINIILSPETTNQNKENMETINSTVKNKSNQQNSNNMNENNNTPEYQKEPTQTIIVATSGSQYNEHIFITPRKSENIEDNTITKVTQRNEIRIPNLKTTSNIKLLNLALVDSEKRDMYNENENEDDNKEEIKIKHYKENINTKKRHKKLNIMNSPILDSTLIKSDKEINIYFNKKEKNNDKQKTTEFQEKSKEEEDSKDVDSNGNGSVIQEEKTQKIEYNEQDL